MSSNIRVTRVCQFCNKEFIARTTVTRYCGDDCAKRAYKARKRESKVQVSNQETTSIIVKPIEAIQAKEFLSITEACSLLGLSRWTLWRVIKNKGLKAIKVGRRTIIKRSDIDSLFHASPSPSLPIQGKKDLLPVEEGITLLEVQKLYGISQQALLKLIKRNNISLYFVSKEQYVHKAAIENIFGESLLTESYD